MTREQVMAELDYLTSPAAMALPEAERIRRTMAATKEAMRLAGERMDALKAFISDFAAHDFTDATKGWPRHPDDEEPAPLTDARTVWDMQAEARELLKGGAK